MNPSAPQHIPLWSTRQVMTATLLVASILALFYLIYRFSQVIFIFFIAIVLSTAIRPAVNWLYRRGLPRPAGIIFLYVLGFSLLAAMAIAVVPILVEQTTEISNEIPAYYGNFRSDLFQSRSRILQEIAIQMPPEFKLTPPIPGSEVGEPGVQAEEQVTRSLPYVDIFVRSVLALTAVFVLGFYWTIESERSIRSVLLWLPKGRREPIREFINEVEEKVGRFILGQGILCLIIGIMALIVYLLIGLPYALVTGNICRDYGSGPHHWTCSRCHPRAVGRALLGSYQGALGNRCNVIDPGLRELPVGAAGDETIGRCKPPGYFAGSCRLYIPAWAGWCAPGDTHCGYRPALCQPFCNLERRG